jgi:hypothetical protein
MLASCKQTPRGCWPYPSIMTDRSRFTIGPIGSLHTGWALKVDGIIPRSSSSLIPLGAYVDAIMAGASEAVADNIARALESSSMPSLALPTRMTVRSARYTCREPTMRRTPAWRSLA